MNGKAAILALALILAGCGGSPKTNFYTLDPVPGARADLPHHRESPIIVGHVDLPAELDRQSLVTHGPGSTIDVSDQNRWAAPLDELIRRAFTSDLRTRLPSYTVLAPGDPTPKGIRTLDLNVRRFMADEAGRVTLEADWSVQDHGASVAPNRARVEINADGTSGGAISTAMSQALGRLADQVAAAL
jgi:uncharacterized protein